MSNPYAKDYSDYFETKELTKVHGEPDIDSLTCIFSELKRNAQKVPTPLGGGILGYLALIILEAIYITLPGATLFVRPVDPGPFIPSNNRLTGAEIAQEKAAHDELKRLYYEVNAVENALRNQLVQAIDKEYIDGLRDPQTYMIRCPIQEIVEYLQSNYGQITPEEYDDRESALKQTAYDPSTPPTLIFTKIKKFRDLSEFTGNSKSDPQLVHIAYLIFMKTKIYKTALLKWNAKPSGDKTFRNMEVHFRTAFFDLKKIGGLTVQDSSINLLQELKSHHENIAADLIKRVNQSNSINLAQAFQLLQPSVPDEDTPPPQLNIMRDDNVLQVLKALQEKVDTLTKKLQNTSNPPTDSNKNTKINPKTGKEWKRCCWTCGCTTHWGKDCPNPAPGHNNQATFQKRMNGSDKGCMPTRA